MPQTVRSATSHGPVGRKGVLDLSKRRDETWRQSIVRRSLPQSALHSPLLADRCARHLILVDAHGVQRIVLARSVVERVIWALLFVIALLAALVHCFCLVRAYLAAPTVWTTHVAKRARPVDFPAVTLCNENALRVSPALLDDEQLRLLGQIGTCISC